MYLSVTVLSLILSPAWLTCFLPMRHCYEQVRVFVAKKSPGRADLAQGELDNEVITAALAGLNVVRLKNGDPFVFGRGGEEILNYRTHGIEPEVVPGVSSALAAPLLAGIPLTMRGIADQFLITTAQGRAGTWPELPPYAPQRTFVFLMGVGRLGELAGRLMAAGYPTELPVAVVERAAQPQQRTVRGNLASIAQLVADESVMAPATIVVGHVCNTLLPA